MVNVKGKWALLTGASRGIGYLSAIFMAKQGCIASKNIINNSRAYRDACDTCNYAVERDVEYIFSVLCL